MSVHSRNDLIKWGAALLLGLLCCTARADVLGTKLYESTPLITGSSMTVTELDLGSSGVLTVKLTDMKFPDLLKTLSFTLTTATSVYEPTHVLDTTVATSGSWSINIAAPVTLYAAIFALPQTGAGKIGAGMYDAQISFVAGAAPVPLPAAGWFLLSGIVGLAAFRPTQKLSQSFA